MPSLSLKNIYEWPFVLRVIVAILISVIFFYFGYVWHFATLNEELTEVKKKEQELREQLQGVIVKQIALQKQVAHFAEQEVLLNQWKKKITPYAKLPDVINEILKTATANNIHFNLFDPGSAVQEDIYFKVPIKAIAVGDYHQLAHFISKIANMPTIIAIRNFVFLSTSHASIKKEETEKTIPGSLTAELNFEVYYFAPIKNAPPSKN